MTAENVLMHSRFNYEGRGSTFLRSIGKYIEKFQPEACCVGMVMRILLFRMPQPLHSPILPHIRYIRYRERKVSNIEHEGQFSPDLTTTWHQTLRILDCCKKDFVPYFERMTNLQNTKIKTFCSCSAASTTGHIGHCVPSVCSDRNFLAWSGFIGKVKS